MSGASRSGSEGLVVGEHVPDRLAELSGDVDLGDLGAALFAEPALVALVALAIDGVLEGVHGRLEQRPAQVLRSVLCERPAAVPVAGLVDARAEPGVAAKLLGRGEARPMSPISAAIVKASTQPIPGTESSSGT